MEDLLDLYAQPFDPLRPRIGFDEQPYQLLDDAHPSLPMTPGQLVREDYEYVRQGTCNLFLLVEPFAGWRHVQVTARRTTHDFARCLGELADFYFPDAEVIRVILDNLNTHQPEALYDLLPPAEARRILRKLEFHWTPKHGSWLNVAEIELSALTRQCLSRRIGQVSLLQSEIVSWESERNRERVRVDWRFTTPDARLKLQRLYPQISN